MPAPLDTEKLLKLVGLRGNDVVVSKGYNSLRNSEMTIDDGILCQDYFLSRERYHLRSHRAATKAGALTRAEAMSLEEEPDVSHAMELEKDTFVFRAVSVSKCTYGLL